MGRRLVRVEMILPIGIPRIHEERHMGEAGHGLLQQREPFPT
jgi:hypothetical protein